MDNLIVNERSVEGGDAQTVISLENLIKNHIQSMDKLVEELKKKREMFNDSFDNNPVYREKNLKVKDVTKDRDVIKNQIAQQPDVATLAESIRDGRLDLKEKKETLSDLLLDYKKKTQATQLELFDGQIVHIVETAKIVKSKSVKQQ